MGLWLILLPLALAAVSAAVPLNRMRPWLLPIGGAAHLAIVIRLFTKSAWTIAPGWLVLDPIGRLVLLHVSVFFLLCAFYTVGYLRYRQERSNRVFCSCLLVLLSTMTLVTWAHHLGILWVAIEATTLATAPLIYFNRTQKSIEATWKYMLVGSVGIAVALLGTFFLAYSSLHAGLDATLSFDKLLEIAPQLSKPWLHAAFIMLLVGYGTKMGLAPMHTWKPEAYGEAPGVVGAILAGGVTSCAFLAILRFYHICHTAGDGVYTSRLLIFIGLFSMAVASLFMIGQRDIKRLLAYSSVEHMGILAFGLGVGGPALYGTLLHILTNGMTKGVLFLSAGNIHRAYGSKNTDHVQGVLRRLPLSGMLFIIGFFAITGSPLFGPFISEFDILNGAFDAHRFFSGGLFLLLLFAAFIGMGTTVLKTVQGRPPVEARETPYRDGILTCLPIFLLLAIVIMLGVYLPEPLAKLLADAVQYLEVQP